METICHSIVNGLICHGVDKSGLAIFNFSFLSLCLFSKAVIIFFLQLLSGLQIISLLGAVGRELFPFILANA